MKRSLKRKLLKAMTLIGCISTGVIYGSIGVIALLSFMKLKDGGADESSFFVLLDGAVAGRVLIWFIILGAACFIMWRFYEAFFDPYEIGNDAKGVMLRTGAAFSSAADAFIAFSAFQALFGQNKTPETGEPVQLRSMVGDVLKTEFGHVAVIATAVVVLLTAFVLVFYGLSSRFTETIKSDKLAKSWRYVVHGFAYYGYFSRGVILAVTGFFLFKAAIENNARHAVNTDKAFDFLGDHIGAAAFIFIAIGTLSYGLYMFVLGFYYDVDVEKKK